MFVFFFLIIFIFLLKALRKVKEREEGLLMLPTFSQAKCRLTVGNLLA